MSEDVRRRTVYLASPLGFAESTAMFMESLVADLRQHVNLLNPWDDHRFDDDFRRAPSIIDRIERLSLYQRVNMEIGRSNTASIDASDAIVAILDGVDVDSGTASEVGYAFARGKRIDGLRSDWRLAGDNEGSTVNLQVEYFIRASGGTIHRDKASLIAAVADWSVS